MSAAETRRFAGLSVLIPIAVSAALAVVAAWPIYESPHAWVGAGVSVIMAAGILVLRLRFRWGTGRSLLLWCAVFVITVLPVATPRFLGGDPMRNLTGWRDALLAVVHGWKQLLTLSLPVGEYQTVLVPFYLALSLSLTATALLASGRRGTRSWAVVPLFIPLVFALVWGAGALSAPVTLPVVGHEFPAPRELAVWTLALVTALLWVRWGAGADHRAAIRRGRALNIGAGTAADAAIADAAKAGASGGPRPRRSVSARGLLRHGTAAVLMIIALVGGALTAPALAALGDRQVPREHVDPNLTIQAEPSILSGYRQSKRTAEFRAPLFRVSGEGTLPDRLALARLDGYDGTTFHVASPDAGGQRFTRFPGVGAGVASETLSVTIEEGFAGIWLPLPAEISGPPRFFGDRGDLWEDSFSLNRETGTGVATRSDTPGTAAGLGVGEGYRVDVRSTPTRTRTLADPAKNGSPRLSGLEMPELAAWVRAQSQPHSAAGLGELLQRLRDRGYLSHALREDEGSAAWIASLRSGAEYEFSPSFAGHGGARIEGMFEDLNRQQRAAGPDAPDRALIAAVGDDEQFAVAAALIADSLGYDTRVVVGVRLGEDLDIPGVPACRETCTGENLAAWVEVAGIDGVWHAIDVTPQSAFLPTELEEGQQFPEYATRPLDLGAKSSDPQLNSGEGESAPTPEEDSAEWLAILWLVLRIVGISLAALALLALPLLYLPIAKRRRRTIRRTQGPAETRALGAWAELLDAHRDRGDTVNAGAPRREQIIALTRTGQDPDLPRTENEREREARGVSLAERVDRAVFARGALPDTEADDIWTDVDAALAALRALDPGRWAAIRRALSTRSLRADVSLSGIWDHFRRLVPRRPERGTNAGTHMISTTHRE